MAVSEPVLPVPRTWATSDKATAALMNSNVRDPVTFRQTPPLWKLSISGTTSVPTATFTSLVWTSADADTYGGWASSPNPSRYTAQVAGWYYVSGDLQIANAATSRRVAGIAVNGTVVRQIEVAWLSAGVSTVVPVVGFLQLNKGDYVELQAWQNSGGALACSGIFFGVWVHS